MRSGGSGSAERFASVDLFIVLKRIQMIAIEVRKKEKEEVTLLKVYQDELLFLLNLFKADQNLSHQIDRVFSIVSSKIDALTAGGSAGG